MVSEMMEGAGESQEKALTIEIRREGQKEKGKGQNGKTESKSEGRSKPKTRKGEDPTRNP
jgi:hypothetical protein